MKKKDEKSSMKLRRRGRKTMKKMSKAQEGQKRRKIGGKEGEENYGKRWKRKTQEGKIK